MQYIDVFIFICILYNQLYTIWLFINVNYLRMNLVIKTKELNKDKINTYIISDMYKKKN